MPTIEDHVAAAKASLYFSGARVWDDMRAFQAECADRCAEIGESMFSGTERLVLTGSGGSYATLLTAKYVLDRVLQIPIEVVTSNELVWRAARGIDESSAVVIATYSGETSDAVAAMHAAADRGARTIGIVGRADSTVGHGSDWAVAYENGSIFELPIVALIRMAAAAPGLDDTARDELARLDETLSVMPDRLEELLGREEERAEQRARDLLWARHLFVLGAGPLSPLAYKVALTVVMENIRIGATYCDASEFRHGPAEALERIRPAMMFMLGTDESRPTTLASIDFCRNQGAEALVFDAAEYGDDIHPMLTPLIMNSYTQWFTVYSAILRGITDLDERVFMGHGVLNASGAVWP